MAKFAEQIGRTEHEEEQRPPEYSTLEIVGIGNEIEDACLKNAVSMEEIRTGRWMHRGGKDTAETHS